MLKVSKEIKTGKTVKEGSSIQEVEGAGHGQMKLISTSGGMM